MLSNDRNSKLLKKQVSCVYCFCVLAHPAKWFGEFFLLLRQRITMIRIWPPRGFFLDFLRSTFHLYWSKREKNHVRKNVFLSLMIRFAFRKKNTSFGLKRTFEFSSPFEREKKKVLLIGTNSFSFESRSSRVFPFLGGLKSGRQNTNSSSCRVFLLHPRPDLGLSSKKLGRTSITSHRQTRARRGRPEKPLNFSPQIDGSKIKPIDIFSLNGDGHRKTCRNTVHRLISTTFMLKFSIKYLGQRIRKFCTLHIWDLKFTIIKIIYVDTVYH